MTVIVGPACLECEATAAFTCPELARQARGQMAGRPESRAPAERVAAACRFLSLDRHAVLTRAATRMRKKPLGNAAAQYGTHRYGDVSIVVYSHRDG